jgi:hypothetical protein
MTEGQVLAAADSSLTGIFSPAAKGLLSTVFYHSRAAKPLSSAELQQLARAAQNRNRSEAITGLVLYDNAHFFQSLEGPSEGLARVMSSIRSDPRHTQIEVLNKQSVSVRRFGNWSMQLATSGPRAAHWKQEVIKPPRSMIDDLRRDPNSAPGLLLKLAPVPSVSLQIEDLPAAPILEALVSEVIIPELARLRRAPKREKLSDLPVDGRAHELARLLIKSDHREALEWINRACASAHPLHLYATLFEPAARLLGDLSRDGLCSEFDVTLGLIQLQTAIRLQRAGSPRVANAAPAVLVVPEPGELHAFTSFLHGETLWQAGWSPRCEYPASDEALQDLLSATWFDALDLSLSTACSREHWLSRVATTIVAARKASRNPLLTVVVGGRIFAEQEEAYLKVGADRGVITSLQVKQKVLDTLTNS